MEQIHCESHYIVSCVIVSKDYEHIPHAHMELKVIGYLEQKS